VERRAARAERGAEMTVTIPDSFLSYFKGYKTYGAGAIAIFLPYLQKYLPWITPDLAAQIAYAALVFAIIFARSGSKNDAADVIEFVKKLLESPVEPEELPK
jgi:hypothetical protein